jgi:hypothetical protein
MSAHAAALTIGSLAKATGVSTPTIRYCRPFKRPWGASTPSPQGSPRPKGESTHTGS